MMSTKIKKIMKRKKKSQNRFNSHKVQMKFQRKIFKMYKDVRKVRALPHKGILIFLKINNKNILIQRGFSYP